MNQIFTLPDGTRVGTGLVLPLNASSAFPAYQASGPMLAMDDVVSIAKAKTQMGRTRFDSSYIANQKSHGSCNGWAGARVLTKARVRRGLDPVMLSGAYLYSLINGGRDNGSVLEDGMQAMQSQGIATEATVGWDAIYPNRYDRAKADAEAAQNKAFECYALNSELELFSALASGFDCVVAVQADNPFMHLDARGVAGASRGPGNHAVHADGLWWDGELIADGANSWGTTYGDQGRMGLTWAGHFVGTYRYQQFYAVRSTLDGTGGSNPP